MDLSTATTSTAKALRRLAKGGTHLGVEAQRCLNDPIGDLLDLNLEGQGLKVAFPQVVWMFLGRLVRCFFKLKLRETSKLTV